MMSSEIFSERLRDLRLSRQLTMEQVANEVGIGKSFLSQVESGKKSVSFEKLVRIADFFEVSTDYLLGRTDNPKRC